VWRFRILPKNLSLPRKREVRLCERLASKKSCHSIRLFAWIPAFAGMTIIALIGPAFAEEAPLHLDGVTAPGFSGHGTAEHPHQTRWGDAAGVPAPDPRPALLREGKVQRLPEEKSDTEEMREAEADAIAARRGLWDETCCRILIPEETGQHTQSWRVVAGRVMAVKSLRNVTYVNFGPDWRTDFTLVIPKRLALRLQPETWTGKTVEARGWIYWQNGPSIEIAVPEQIRLPESANQD